MKILFVIALCLFSLKVYSQEYSFNDELYYPQPGDTTVMKADMIPIQELYWQKKDSNIAFVTPRQMQDSMTSNETRNGGKKVSFNDSTIKFVTPAQLNNRNFLTSASISGLLALSDTVKFAGLYRKNTFTDTNYTKSLLAVDTNSYVGTSFKPYKSAYFKEVPKINNVNMNDVVSVTSSATANIIGILGLLPINKRTLTLRDGTQIIVLVP